MATIKRSGTGSLVYSTEQGRTCPACHQAIERCVCKKKSPIPMGDGIVRVSKETKGRNGKSVTVIKGIPLDAAALEALGKRLKTACGSGGTAKEGVLEIQGDHCEKVIVLLQQQGWTVKRVGG